MQDYNTLAVLIPSNERARNAFGLPHNAERYYRGSENIVPPPVMGSRQSTPAAEEPSDMEYTNGPHIVLALDRKPKDPRRGWRFGIDRKTSDILLSHQGAHGISKRHFTIFVTEELCIKLYDERSKNGTTVSYNEEARKQSRIDHLWLLAMEPRSRRFWREVKVHVPKLGFLEFTIKFPNHKAGHSEYVANLREFVNESRTALPQLDCLDLASGQTTATVSQPETPFNQPSEPGKIVYIVEEYIGRGSFGIVNKVIDTADGKFYAAKAFFPAQTDHGNIKKRKLEKAGWLSEIRNEVQIMQRVSHENLMEFFIFREDPAPILFMPFYPLGSLEKHEDIAHAECISILRQILLALQHLHGKDIVHRDLKPANILVARRFDRIVVSDFGLSRLSNGKPLTTVCGTAFYAAPEIYAGNSYGCKADIWSAGVIIYDLTYGLPNVPSGSSILSSDWNNNWAEAIITDLYALHGNGDSMLNCLAAMLERDPFERDGVNKCLARCCREGVFTKLANGRIIDGSIRDSNADDQKFDDEINEDDFVGEFVGDGNKTPTQDSTQSNEMGVKKGEADGSTTLTQASRPKTDIGVNDVENDGSTTPTRSLRKGNENEDDQRSQPREVSGEDTMHETTIKPNKRLRQD
ncbi:MAG: hypothetical protein Q9208_000252 [Pyrenodesmia sp. 3 TL-2023]